jgi:hypothetical protein
LELSGRPGKKGTLTKFDIFLALVYFVKSKDLPLLRNEYPFLNRSTFCLKIFARSLINLPPNLPINNTTIIPITGIIIVSGGHKPSVNTGENTSSSLIGFALRSSFFGIYFKFGVRLLLL